MSGGPIVVGSDDRVEDTTRVDVPRWTALAELVLSGEGVAAPAELNLHFVDEEPMTELNAAHLGGTGPTDVLAFPLDDAFAPLREEEPRLLGDVVICPRIVRRQAVVDLDGEMALMVVHGVLHILGMDHAEPTERAEMQAAERRHLARWSERVGP